MVLYVTNATQVKHLPLVLQLVLVMIIQPEMAGTLQSQTCATRAINTVHLALASSLECQVLTALTTTHALLTMTSFVVHVRLIALPVGQLITLNVLTIHLPLTS